MSARRTCLAAAALVLSLVAPATASHLESFEPGPAPPGGPLFHVHCEDGVAEGYACHHVDLLAQLPLSSFGAATSANDIWGWTDPQTGREYALLGLNNGTAFVDVSEPDAPVYLGRCPRSSATRPGQHQGYPITPSS